MNLIVVFVFLAALTIDSTWGQGRRGPQPSDPTGSARRGLTSTTERPPPRARPTKSASDRPRDDDDDDDERDDKDVPPFSCPRADGLFADAADCKRFYLCGSFRAYSQACPPSLYFDDKLKFCTFKTATLACGPVPEEELVKEKTYNQDNFAHCDRSKCQLPNCYCSEDGTQIPGGFNANQVPQMILLAFSGAVNELVFGEYKKVLGYNGKFSTQQTRLNPNGCGVRATFFLNHEYTNYANVQWLASEGHEIAIHSITHRLPETWWTDNANYSEWSEEMIGMREILIKFGNGGVANKGALSRENILGMRAPYIKPGGDAMFEMAHDFGLAYDSSIVAPRGSPPYWPFTFDYRQPFDCYNSNKNGNPNGNKPATESNPIRNSRQKREVKPSKNNKKNKKASESLKAKSKSSKRSKRASPFLGRPLRCPTKAYPGLWEVPVNPLYNDVNTCPHADQCVFPSSEENDDSADIVDFLLENFERHYTTNRAPFQLNFHVNWFTSKTKVRALSRFVEHVIKNYKDTHFVTYQQMINWMRDPQPVTNLDFKCGNSTGVAACSRPHTCVLKHYLDKDNSAATVDNTVRTDTRYMALCQHNACPPQFPWYGNHAGATRNFKTIMQLVEEATGPETGSDSSKK